MSRKTNTGSLGNRGEKLAVTELRQRGFRVKILGPRAHDWDLVAKKGSRELKIHVKTIGGGAWQCGNATKYIKINLINEKQSVTGKQTLSNPDGIYIFVNLKEQRTFCLAEAREVQDLVFSEYKANLRRHKGRRPRNQYAFHLGTTMSKLVGWKDNWKVLTK